MFFILIQDYLFFSHMVRPNKVLKPTYAAVNSYSPKYRTPDETPFKISTPQKGVPEDFRKQDLQALHEPCYRTDMSPSRV